MYDFIVWLMHPYMLLMVFALLAVINLWRKRQESKRRLLLVTLPVVLLYLWSMPFVAGRMMATVEQAYPTVLTRPTEAEAIVVLGGWMRKSDDVDPTPRLGTDSLHRCMRGVELYNDGPPVPIVTTGRLLTPNEVDPSMAQVMANFIKQLGVPARDVIVEGESTSTFENAENTAKILNERGLRNIVLVTDATHLIRAKATFERHGFTVTPVGTFYRSGRINFNASQFIPSDNAPRTSQTALHEWMGLLWYWIKGRV